MILAQLKRTRTWLPDYVVARLQRHPCSPRRVWVTIADHFEPFWRGAGVDEAAARVNTWLQEWPKIAARHRDALQRPPKHTFFYAEEQYSPRHLDALASLARAKIADVEVHMHHDGEGEPNFVERISTFTERLFHRHGLLRKVDGSITFGFIHGNWALDNSRADGRWCGLNNEISLLQRLGCYADFTLPSAPSECQTRIVNTIYWATDDPARPKSHDRGVPVAPGEPVSGDLMLIPGPLAIYWNGDRLLPRIENGELAGHYPVTAKRVRTWLKVAPRIGEDIFIKLFTHGANESNSRPLLTGDLDFTLQTLAGECNRLGLALYYTSAFEMWSVVDALRQLRNPLQALKTAQARPETQCLRGSGN